MQHTSYVKYIVLPGFILYKQNEGLNLGGICTPVDYMYVYLLPRSLTLACTLYVPGSRGATRVE